MIVLVHEKHDRWRNVTPVKRFCWDFDHANHVIFFRSSKHLPKIYSIKFSNVLFFEYGPLKRFI